ncbi:MAG: hypothetical protein EBS65_24095 [Betaproteobacteria bacterium]|nr:hypothetical protein [Betaproteobacteria bacterium]
MRLQDWHHREGVGLEAEFLGRLVEGVGTDVADQERPAVEFLPSGLKRFLGRLEIGGLECIAECRERVVRIVVDGVDHSRPSDAARRRQRTGDQLHRHVEDLAISNANGLHGETFREGPARVVVRGLLRILRAPVLIVEERVGNTRVRLIHADDVAPRWELTRFRRRRLGRVDGTTASTTTSGGRSRTLHRHLRGERRRGTRDLDRLLAHHLEQLGLGAGARIEGDSLIITPMSAERRRALGTSALIQTVRDHRIAMAFAVLGLQASGVQIVDPGCVAKSYPAFWTDLARMIRPQ